MVRAGNLNGGIRVAKQRWRKNQDFLDAKQRLKDMEGRKSEGSQGFEESGLG